MCPVFEFTMDVVRIIGSRQPLVGQLRKDASAGVRVVSVDMK